MSLSRSLSDQIYAKLREQILSGSLPAGSKLLLKDIQEQFSVSSTPARDAINRLAQDRFVEYAANQGAKVIELTAKDIRELLDLRCLCDCYALEKIMQLSDRSEVIAELERSIAHQKHYHALGTYEGHEYGEVCYNFHEILTAHSGNSWLMNCASQYNSLLFLADARQKINSYPQEAIDEHQAILDAIIQGDLALAVERLKSHRVCEETRFRLENRPASL